MARKYIVNGENYFEDARQAADHIMDESDNDAYDEMLDEVYGDIEICGYSYSASIALYRVDETAYRCGRNDWADGEASNIADEIENMGDGDEIDFFGFTVVCEDKDDEDEDE